MMQFPDLNPDSMVAELNYRRERLIEARHQQRVRRMRIRRHRSAA